MDKLQEAEDAEDYYDLVAGLNALKLTPAYQLRKQSLDVLDNISDSLRVCVEEYGRRILRNQFLFDLVQSVRSPETVSYKVDARHRVMPEIWLEVKIVFRAVGTEVVVEASSSERVEQLYRCRFDQYENSIEFQSVFKVYLARVLSGPVRTANA